MTHENSLVDVFNTDGRIIGQKRRREIDKRTDIFNGVHVVVVTLDGELALSRISQRDDLPNRFVGLLSSSMATIRRHEETIEQAARRGLEKELFVSNAALRLVRDGLVELEDGSCNWVTAYVTELPQPVRYSESDIDELTFISAQTVAKMLEREPDLFSPTFKVIWLSLMLQ